MKNWWRNDQVVIDHWSRSVSDQQRIVWNTSKPISVQTGSRDGMAISSTTSARAPLIKISLLPFWKGPGCACLVFCIGFFIVFDQWNNFHFRYLKLNSICLLLGFLLCYLFPPTLPARCPSLHCLWPPWPSDQAYPAELHMTHCSALWGSVMKAFLRLTHVLERKE